MARSPIIQPRNRATQAGGGSIIHENRIADMPLSTSTSVWQRCLPGTFFPRVLSFKDRVQLLERPSLRLNKEEVDEHKLEQIPKHEEDVAMRR